MPEMVLTPCGHRCDLCEAWRGRRQGIPRQVMALDDVWRARRGHPPKPARGTCDGCPATMV